VQSEVEKLSTTYEAQFDGFLKMTQKNQLPFPGKVQDSSDDELHVFASHDQEKQKIVISSVDEIQDDTISSVDKKAD